ncbi:MAG: deoxyribonuclease IV [Bdellovibrionales bacterium]|nr:deoxyribonuclease IV [Bdellovibrionales bacterium]
MISYFGAHVSVSGGLEKAIENASALGVNSIQIHPSPPQRWNRNPYPPGYEEKFLELKARSSIEKVFFHAIYLINLVSPERDKVEQAKDSLAHYLDLLGRIQGDGVIVHVGSLKDEPDDLAGFQRAAVAIDEILARTPESSRLILEVSAGSGRIVGARFEELREIYNRVQAKQRLGFGLDTQHMWASGYDIKDDLEGVMSSIGEVFGFEKVWSIHLNDSKTELASKKDRHENLGDGLIGEPALRTMLARPEFQSIPWILETPALKEMETAKAETQKLSDWVHSLG